MRKVRVAGSVSWSDVSPLSSSSVTSVRYTSSTTQCCSIYSTVQWQFLHLCPSILSLHHPKLNLFNSVMSSLNAGNETSLNIFIKSCTQNSYSKHKGHIKKFESEMGKILKHNPDKTLTFFITKISFAFPSVCQMHSVKVGFAFESEKWSQNQQMF